MKMYYGQSTIINHNNGWIYLLSDIIYPLVKVYIPMERTTMLLQVKLTASMFSIANCNKLPEGILRIALDTQIQH